MSHRRVGVNLIMPTTGWELETCLVEFVKDLPTLASCARQVRISTEQVRQNVAAAVAVATAAAAAVVAVDRKRA